MPVEDLGISESQLSDSLPYVSDVVRDANGKLKGISWQACPGAFFYRRSFAKDFLGTDDPEQVQEMLKDIPTFMATAEKLKQASGDTVKMLAGPSEMQTLLLGSRQQGWVEDNTLVIDPKVDELLEVGKKLIDGGYTAQADGWSEDLSLY